MRTDLARQRKRWTYEEYYRSTAEGDWFEFIDGAYVGAERSKLTIHQEWSREIARLLNNPAINVLGELYFGPLDIAFNAENVVQPDLLFVTNSRKSIIEDRAIFGSPDIMIEIVSPVTLVMDRYRKPELYARFAVPEYWIVDPGQSSIEILALESGKYRLHSFAAEEGQLQSQVLAFQFDVSDVILKAFEQRFFFALNALPIALA